MNSFSSPKTVYFLIIVLIFGLIFIDHLTSQTSGIVAAPGDAGPSCAPCGAPCK